MIGHKSNHTSKKVAVLPDQEDLIDFNHSAAGHEGISSNASGSLIIKPCTQDEIDFYESAKDHELFQAHMPTFMGSLTLNQDPDIGHLLQDQGALQTIRPLTASNTPAMPTPIPVIENTSSTIGPIPKSTKRISWKPSGGKKLTTGLAIVLENAAAGFKRPNILDAKLGARLWDDNAPEAKRQKLDQVSKETTSSSLGFRIAGMKMWLGDESQSNSNSGSIPDSEKNVQIKDNYRCYDKNYGRVFQDGNVKDAFVTYLGGSDTKDKRSVAPLKNKWAKIIAKRFLSELESIRWVLDHEESRMYSASVLMVYEGDENALELALREEEEEQQQQMEDGKPATRSAPPNLALDGQANNDLGVEAENVNEDDDEEETEHKVHDVRLIDFAHAHWTPGQGPDENALQGVRSIIRILKEIISD